MDSKRTGVLPLASDQRGIQILTVLVLVLMTGLSVVGLVWSDHLYPTREMVQSFMTNDLINLLIGLPVVVVALLLIRRGRLTGLLLLPGSMLYVVYNSIAYLVARRFDLFSVGHLLLILMCVVGMVIVFSRIDAQAVQEKLQGKIPAKFSGWVLAGFGILFFFRAVAMFTGALIQSTAIPVSEVGVLVADMVLSVLMFIGGVMLLRGRAMGTAAGLGLLFAASMLFIGLIVLLIIQAVISNSTFPYVDILVVAVMGPVCFVPFIRYLSVCARQE